MSSSPHLEEIGAIIETRLRFEDPHVESTPKASQQDAEQRIE